MYIFSQWILNNSIFGDSVLPTHFLFTFFIPGVKQWHSFACVKRMKMFLSALDNIILLSNKGYESNNSWVC